MRTAEVHVHDASIHARSLSLREQRTEIHMPLFEM